MAEEKKEDKALWQAFKLGNEEAFSQLFFEYYHTLYHYGIRLAGEEEFVKDTIQNFFLYIFENRENLTEEINSLTAYLLASFRRLLLRDLKNKKREKYSNIEDIATEHHGFSVGAEDIIIREESMKQDMAIVVRLLNELPPRQREIIYLKYYHDLSLTEISEALSISYQVVANHLYRALKKLRQSNSAQRFSNFRFLF